MEIKYKIEELLEKKDLLPKESGTGLTFKKEGNSLLMKASSRDLIELADILVSIALDSSSKNHIHLDDLTLLRKDSEISEFIIEKEK